ncbi:L-serine ammonia-lyase, iron-sulfur-dependent, subunit alpha, partial [Staphylococcus warneri]
MLNSIQEIIDYAVENETTFVEIMISEEMSLKGISRDEVRALMKQNI